MKLQEIMKLLEQINLRGTTIVMVTHAKDIVDRMNKRVIVIDKGKIVRDNVGAYGIDVFETPSCQPEGGVFSQDVK